MHDLFYVQINQTFNKLTPYLLCLCLCRHASGTACPVLRSSSQPGDTATWMVIIIIKCYVDGVYITTSTTTTAQPATSATATSTLPATTSCSGADEPAATTCTAADSQHSTAALLAAPAAAAVSSPVFIYVEAGCSSSSRRSSIDSTADTPCDPCMQQQQHEIADAVAAEGNTSRNHALAAAPLAAGVKAKLPLQQQQLGVCDIAAAVAGIADNEQQHTQLLQCLPVAESAAATTVAAVVAGRELSKQLGWLW
jgi:hypothetical protein